MRCGDGQLRYLNANYNKTTKNLIKNWTSEIIRLYGTRIDYFVYNYKTGIGRHDFLYGEDPAANFSKPIGMTAVAKINSDSLMLSKFGLQTNSDIEVYVDYDTFAQAIGNAHAFPKAGDLIRLTEVGLDRPGGGGYPYAYGVCPSGNNGNPDGDNGDNPISNCLSTTSECNFLTGDAMNMLACCLAGNGANGNGADDLNSMNEGIIDCESNPMSGWLRGPNIYEITSVQDENLAQGINPMLSHTCWYIKAIRFDNSYQPDAPVEAGSNMVNDSSYYGKLPGGSETPENEKYYRQNSDEENDRRNWNYDKYGLDAVYGGYGQIDKNDLKLKVTYSPSMDPYSDKYSELFTSLDFIDLKDLQVGTLGVARLHFHNDSLALCKVENPESTTPKMKIFLGDSSPCQRDYDRNIYAVFVYDETIAFQYIGKMGNADDIVYNCLYIKNIQDDGPESVMKLYMYNGALTYMEVENVTE